MHWTLRAELMVVAMAVCALACGDPKVPVGDTEGGSQGSTTQPETGTTEPSTSPTTPTMTTADPQTTGGTDTPPDPTGGPMPTQREADILFVIDNSGSLGDAQAQVAASIPSFVNVLDAGGVDYRIGVTTTDNGNPWCQTSSEAGNMVASSCRSRLPDFIFQGATTVNAEAACTDHCPSEWTSIELQPTPIDGGTPQVRPWVEAGPGGTNLPEGLEAGQALQCLLPQGINGCGFEQPLESMYKALRRTESEGEDELGFHRDGALLSIIIITDEVDCSHDNAFESIFLPDGMRTFWSDPQSASPTSAVCWNAGVMCTGGPGTYDSCDSANYDVAGSVVAPDDAVLRPVERYVDLLSALPDTHAYAIAGVPEGYPDVPITYADAPGGTPNDPNFQINYGIGPGCQSQTSVVGVPPVRIREVLEVLPPDNDLFSICSLDYSEAFSAIAQSIVETLP